MEDFYFKFSGADTYKAVRNFIKNGLGLNRQDIADQIKNEAISYAEKAINEFHMSKRVDTLIEQRITRALVNRFGYDSSDSLKSYIEKRVEAEVRNQVSEIIKNNFVFKIKEKPTRRKILTRTFKKLFI